jgi:hypothetical protein
MVMPSLLGATADSHVMLPAAVPLASSVTSDAPHQAKDPTCNGVTVHRKAHRSVIEGRLSGRLTTPYVVHALHATLSHSCTPETLTESKVISPCMLEAMTASRTTSNSRLGACRQVTKPPEQPIIELKARASTRKRLSSMW